MRKETINTFSDGMSLDLNPLGTPAKTLTNCLNGTLITYNGNELTLQNDMGNTQVGTAALPKGYVPIGMKEHGGIIYVASYNPETKKGQLGCFPSPQQIYTSEAAQTVIDINLQETFIQMVDNFPFIKFNEYKEEIFKDSITQDPKVFNSGDLFIIKTEENFSELLRQAIDENIISIKLYVIPTIGGDNIEITNCENTQLTIYEDTTDHKDLWIFQNEGNIYEGINESIPFDVLISEYPQYLQSYPRNIGSGILQIQIEFNMFKLFNLYNKIERIQEGFNVQFIGQAEPDDYDLCTPVSKESLIPLSLIGNINYQKHYTIEDFEELSQTENNYNNLEAKSKIYSLLQNETLYYDILPASKWGIADNTFLKSGILSYNEIINNEDKIVNWEFEINKSEAIIKWRFINVSNDIDHLRFVFIPLDQVFDNNNDIKSKYTIDTLYITKANTEESQYVYKIVKPYYSGDFEDTFPIDEDHLQKNYIYLCRIDIIYKNKNVKNASDYKLLYTGNFFNDKNISDFGYNNRPNIEINLNMGLQQEQTLLNKEYTLIKEENNGITKQIKDSIISSDVMLLGDTSNVNKLVGAIVDAEYEVTSNLIIKNIKSISYNDKAYQMQSFAGNLEDSLVLNEFSSTSGISFDLSSETEYLYSDDGDALVEQCKKDYIEQEEVNGINLKNNQTILYTKDSSDKYKNTSTIKIHRGIISRLGQAEEKNVIHQGLYPIYEKEDTAYNEQLFGFRIDDDTVENCILGKSGSLHNYIANIQNKDSIYESVKYPFSENAIVQGDSGFISKTTDYDEDTIFKTIKNIGNKPINLCITNQVQHLKAWPGGDIQEFKFMLTMPHEISFNESSDAGEVYSKHYVKEHAEEFKENNLGYSDWRDQQAFFRPDYTKNCMSILWRTQYGPRLINIATPLNIENEETQNDLIIIKKKANTSDKFSIYTDKKKHAFSNMHLRAEKLLLCMLSQILITKCKNGTLSLNAPDIIYSTSVFSNDLLLSLNKTKIVSLTLNGKSIDKAISELLRLKILDNEDIFIPSFNISIKDLHLIINDTLYTSSLQDIFEGSEIPYFSSVTEEELKNIYPGKILSIEDKYICKLQKNENGTYAKNEDIMENGKFYKIFLPTLISEVNDSESQFNCTNTDTYKFILEGLAYNDVLLPATKILDMQNIKTKNLRSQDSDNPQFNLVYYNAFTKQWFGTGAVTLFGDQSAFINTSNFNESSDFPKPVFDMNAWKNVEVLLDEDSAEQEENIEE